MVEGDSIANNLGKEQDKEQKHIENPDELIVYSLKIPKERLAVLIGKSGKTKKDIEERTNTIIKVNSKEGDITISGKDALRVFSAKEVVRAIGRGFNPDIASLLTKQDYLLEIIPVKEYAKTKNSMIRLKGRVIGEKGKARRYIEKMTDCYICVYGKTISIIGRVDNINDARRAVEQLLSGAKHSSVYRFLERRRRVMKYRSLDYEHI